MMCAGGQWARGHREGSAVGSQALPLQHELSGRFHHFKATIWQRRKTSAPALHMWTSRSPPRSALQSETSRWQGWLGGWVEHEGRSFSGQQFAQEMCQVRRPCLASSSCSTHLAVFTMAGMQCCGTPAHRFADELEQDEGGCEDQEVEEYSRITDHPVPSQQGEGRLRSSAR